MARFLKEKKHKGKEFTYLEEGMLFLGKFAPGIRVVLVSSENFNKIICSSRCSSSSRSRSSSSSHNITDIVIFSLA